jgi:hypothetical protein
VKATASTIQRNIAEQWVGCQVCTEVHEIPRRLLRDPEQLLNFVDEVKHDHRECAANPDNPHLAKLNRDFRKRTEREARRANENHANGDRLRRRCSGR